MDYTFSVELAQQAGDQLELTSRQIYNLLKRYRNYDYQLLSLLPQKPTGGKNKTRLKFSVEQIIQTIFEERYLPNPQIKISLIVEEIMRCCTRADICPPADRTIRRRIESLSSKFIDVKNQSRHASKKHAGLSILSSYPDAEIPHGIWQIDHTPVDLIVVDEIYRKPIGRPYLTIAIDVYSRCILGFCLTMASILQIKGKRSLIFYLHIQHMQNQVPALKQMLF